MIAPRPVLYQRSSGAPIFRGPFVFCSLACRQIWIEETSREKGLESRKGQEEHELGCDRGDKCPRDVRRQKKLTALLLRQFPDDLNWKPQDLIKRVLDLCDLEMKRKQYGPYRLVLGAKWGTRLDMPYFREQKKEKGKELSYYVFSLSVRERLQQISLIGGIEIDGDSWNITLADTT